MTVPLGLAMNALVLPEFAGVTLETLPAYQSPRMPATVRTHSFQRTVCWP